MTTIDEIRNCGKTFLTPDDIAGVLGSHPQTIRVSAREHPELVGYPFTFVGTNMKIPRLAFIKWLTGERGEIQQ